MRAPHHDANVVVGDRRVGGQQLRREQLHELPPRRGQRVASLLEVGAQPADRLAHVERAAGEALRQLAQHRVLAADVVQRAAPGVERDAMTALVALEPDDPHRADLPRARAVGPTAGGQVEAVDVDHPHVAVDLRRSPQRHGAELLRGREERAHDRVAHDHVVDQVLGPGEAALVERSLHVDRARGGPEPGGHGLGAGHLDQRAGQSVLGGVLSHVVAPSRGVDDPAHRARRPRRKIPFDQVVDDAVVVHLHVDDPQLAAGVVERVERKHAGVEELPARLGVEQRPVEDEAGPPGELPRARGGLERGGEGVGPVELFGRRGGLHGDGAVLAFRPMEVTVNGATQDVPEGLTVRGLVTHLGLGDGPVAVEINRAIVPRATHGQHPVQAGDVIEIVHFVGGG